MRDLNLTPPKLADYCRSMASAGAIRISAEILRELVARMFVATGLQRRAADRVAAGLVEADLQGLSSHGVMLMDMYIERLRHGSVSTKETAAVVCERDAAVVLDAGHALGQLTGEQAMDLAIERARRFGVGVAAVRHGFHFGTARRYAERAAQTGCIGIAMCNTRPLMPAPGGAERLVGNNPIAIALPVAGGIPVVLDMATSEAAMGKIRLGAKAGVSIPRNWAVASDGSPTTDPAKAIAGMLLPAGGAKGFGLAFVIDLMCGLLSGGAAGQEVQPLYGDPSIPYDCSHLFIAIHVAHFADLEHFRTKAQAAAERVRTSRPAAGVQTVFAPGEPEWRKSESSADQVTLAPEVCAMLVRLARELNVSAGPLVTQETGSGHAQT
jgi:LDH2 family malate/lactate/ureidoglycolate dehydrogenase